ncbi:hypothetical protein Cflav_PD6461 [Pedosphaera parvula Ellin514]|uniref:Uncharacterized protein n=1 Tax=Pedosphaera parvula (strain Ellin514) TaxID=320771 RepID=B9XDP0_PEDPL|nr:hypothetical protein Cflav_PD6461 [Pedosphaera parvula Ellin514]
MRIGNRGLNEESEKQLATKQHEWKWDLNCVIVGGVWI